MRRFMTASITMLAGIVAAPACAAIVGIDTDRMVADGGLGTSPTTTSTGTSSGGSDASSSSSGSVPPPPDSSTDGSSDPCAACMAGGFTSCTAELKQCKRTCDSATACATGSVFKCPEGWQCSLDCKNGCQGVTCVGGIQCSFDCTTGNCGGSQCGASVCRYTCGQGVQCNGVQCLGDQNTTCSETCGSGSATKPCKDPIHCCTEGGKRTCPPDNSVCP